MSTDRSAPLLDWRPYPESPGYQGRDTSAAAAASVASTSATLRDAVLAALRTKPMTVHECAFELGEPVPSVQPRFSELVALARIVDSGTRRPNFSGRLAIVWRVAG